MSNNDELNPIRLWREWFVKSEKAWSDSLSEMMGNEHFSQGLGRYIVEALHTHRMFSETMAQYLANLNVPSRGDILSMGDRLAQTESTLDQILVEMRQQRAEIARGAPQDATEATSKRPARTRQPASKNST